MKTVYVGMSGGVDSSVAAALLRDEGNNVVGVYMKNWTADVAGVACPWRQDLADARAAAAALDIPFKVFDFQVDYKALVVDAMVAEYAAGRTPNPDVMCNQQIKFNLFLKAAQADGADAIATGHYARSEGRLLYAPTDTAKDQTYFLYRVTPEALEHTIFPLAGLTKPQVRQLAHKYHLPTADKPDSQGICFIGEVGIKQFLDQYIDPSPGAVVHHITGRELGRHAGAAYFTVGQRQGLGIGGGQPLYVIRTDISSGTVYVTDDPNDVSLTTDTYQIGQLHWISEPPSVDRTYKIRSRYRAEAISGRVSVSRLGYQVRLDKPERAITSGQSAVIYDGDLVLGGGIIA